MRTVAVTRVCLARVGLALTAASLVAGVGCSDDGHAHFADAGYDCSIEDRDDTFVAGLEKTGAGGVRIRITSAVPAPPQRGDNTFNLEVFDGAGAPISGASIDVTPFMPDHRHGTSIAPVIAPGAAPGSYTVSMINLWMPGLWEITIEATPAGGMADEVVFRFCIAS